MKIFRSLHDVAASTGASVVTIGNFDGVHRGHRMVIDNVIARALALNARSVAITFDPHPIRVLHPEVDVRLITPLPQKLELLAATGIDATLVIPFTPAFSQWTAREFATRVLCDALRTVEVHEGENFRFGHDAAEDVTGLTHLGEELGFTVRAYHPADFRGAPISSTRIRNLIANGDMHHARALLGRPFAVRSTPAPGRGYGTRYAVPTINIAPYADLLPTNGVYITTLRISNNPNAGIGNNPNAGIGNNSNAGISDNPNAGISDNPGAPSSPAALSPDKVGPPATSRLFHSVTNCGNRPTFGADSFAVESHCLDFEPIELTESTPLELTFLHRLRGEVRFPTTEALHAQINLDVAQAKRYFSLCQALLRAT